MIAIEGRWGCNHVFGFKAKAGKMDVILLALCYDPMVFDSLKSQRKSTEIWRAPHIVLMNILHSTLIAFLEGIVWKVHVICYYKNEAVTKLVHFPFASH